MSVSIRKTGVVNVGTVSETYTGSIVTFNSQYALPLKSHKVALTATQSGSGTPSPDNVRTINGYSAINIGSDNKYAGFINFNQLIKNSYATNTAYGVTTSYDTTTHEFSITNDSRTTKFNTGATYSGVSNVSPVAGHKYYIRVTSDKDITGVTVGNISGVVLTDNSEDVIVLPSSWDTQYGFCFRITNRYDFVNAHPIGDVTKCKIVLMDLTDMFGAGNEPSTVDEVRALFPNDYYDYNAGTLTTVSAVNGVSNSMFTIQIGSTVYGGEYDARTGVLTVTHKSVVFDGSEQGWTLNQVQSNNAVYITISDKKTGWQTSICDKLQNVNGCWGNSTDMGLFCDHPSLKRVYFNRPDNSLSLFFTVEDWKTWLSNNNVRVCYELENPQTIQLPPCPIDTLEGVNNIWADTGETTLTPYAGGFNEINAVRASIAEGYINSTEFIEI